MEASTAALFFPTSSMIAALISGGSFWNCATSISRTDLSFSSVIAPAAFASTSPLRRGRPRRDAHFGIAVADQRNDRVNVRAGQSADLRERVKRRGLEFRAARSRERIDQSLAMRLSGFARLAEALRRSDADVAARIVEQWPNGVRIFRGRLRSEDDGEDGSANIWVGIARYI